MNPIGVSPPWSPSCCLFASCPPPIWVPKWCPARSPNSQKVFVSQVWNPDKNVVFILRKHYVWLPAAPLGTSRLGSKGLQKHFRRADAKSMQNCLSKKLPEILRGTLGSPKSVPKWYKMLHKCRLPFFLFFCPRPKVATNKMCVEHHMGLNKNAYGSRVVTHF